MSRAIVDEETYVVTSQQAEENSYVLLNGQESTTMNAAQLQEALFDMVINNRSTHFTVTEGDGMTFIRVTKGLQG
jgi:hypothetical protein